MGFVLHLVLKPCRALCFAHFMFSNWNIDLSSLQFLYVSLAHAVIWMSELGHTHHLHILLLPQLHTHAHTHVHTHTHTLVQTQSVNISFGIHLSSAWDRECWVYMIVLYTCVLSPRVLSVTGCVVATGQDAATEESKVAAREKERKTLKLKR